LHGDARIKSAKPYLGIGDFTSGFGSLQKRAETAGPIAIRLAVVRV
jgi:hypothetical protein